MRLSRLALRILALFVLAAPAVAQETGPLQITLDQTAYYAGDSLSVTVRNVSPEPVSLTTCGGQIERRAEEGLWVPVDTLQCDVARRMPLVGRNRSSLRLHANILRSLLREHRTGWYRIVFDAVGPDDRPLPLEGRSAGPFRLLDFEGAHPEALADYEGRRGWKALATARRAVGGYLWGYSYDFRTAVAAANRALEECRKRKERELTGECWIERLDGPDGETPE